MLSFNNLKQYFDIYIDNCYIKISEKFNGIDDEKVMCNLIKRNSMIKQKYNHTMRVVENITQMSKKMGQSINFLELTKAVGLLHDIGRFEQAMYSDTYVDSVVYRNNPIIKNHGEEGERFLVDNGFKLFKIPRIDQPAIAKTVGLHQENQLPKIFDYVVDISLCEVDPNKILTGTYNFNELEQQIISLLLQMIRDIDKIDILYQRAIGEITSVPEIIEIKNIGKDNIFKVWGITLVDLKELNSLEDIENKDKLKIYTSKIPIEKLFVKNEIKSLMYQGKSISLKDLQARDDYSFITAIWWSIYTFLSDINFVSNLEVIQENNLLKQIYEKYPEEYRPLIDEIFSYAKERLIDERICENKNNLYVKKRL